jgi:hypothetical protein
VTSFDGMQCGNGSGDSVVYEIFDPPWWRIDRWFNWYCMQRKAARGTLELLIAGTPKRVKCRARSSPMLLVKPKVPPIFPSHPLH